MASAVADVRLVKGAPFDRRPPSCFSRVGPSLRGSTARSHRLLRLGERGHETFPFRGVAQQLQIAAGVLDEDGHLAGQELEQRVRSAVGADRFMTQLGIDVTNFLPAAQRLGEQGKSPLYAAIDGRLAAVIGLSAKRPCRPQVRLLQDDSPATRDIDLSKRADLHIREALGVNVEKWLFELPPVNAEAAAAAG